MHRTARIKLRSPILIAIVCALSCAGPAVAMAPLIAPTVVIAGPTKGSPGDLVVLDASGSRDAVGFAWVLADSDKTFLEVENGRKIVFASGSPGRYTFVAVGANADSSGKPSVAVAKHVLTIGDPGPPPNPVPPNPDPPLPPGKYGLATFARDNAAGVALDATNKKSTALSLANSFESIASTIAAGALKDAAAIITATQSNNAAALGAYRPSWQPWGEQLRQKLNTLSESRQLVSTEDYATAWREIATGLRAVK